MDSSTEDLYINSIANLDAEKRFAKDSDELKKIDLELIEQRQAYLFSVFMEKEEEARSLMKENYLSLGGNVSIDEIEGIIVSNRSKLISLVSGKDKSCLLVKAHGYERWDTNERVLLIGFLSMFLPSLILSPFMPNIAEPSDSRSEIWTILELVAIAIGLSSFFFIRSRTLNNIKKNKLLIESNGCTCNRCLLEKAIERNQAGSRISH